jgi:hypothetical protein
MRWEGEPTRSGEPRRGAPAVGRAFALKILKELKNARIVKLVDICL